MNKLSDTQIAYLAGFIDGEGCLSIYKHHRPTGHGSFNVTVRVTNTDKSIIETIQQWTGLGTVRMRSPRKGFLYRKTQWEWTINPSSIRELFPVIMPYLQIKRPLAELITEFLGYKARVRGRHVTQMERDRCDMIAEKIRQTNQRSVAGAVV